MKDLKDHFRGALLGNMAGDVLGAPLEGMSLLYSKKKGQVRDIIPSFRGKGRYTDDTQLMIGLAEALCETPGKLDLDRVAFHFGENYEPDRGYGGNTHGILAMIQKGRPWRQVVDDYSLPGGSFGNGSAMRVSPIALAFYSRPAKVVEAADEQSRVTAHDHSISITGTRLQALSVHRGLVKGTAGEDFGGLSFIQEFLDQGSTDYDKPLSWIRDNLDAEPETAARALGTGVAAIDSVPAALWAFLSTDSAEEAIVRAVNLGGDTDTIGAMAGAVAGAYYGAESLPDRWLDNMENGPKGRDYVIKLADTLHENLDKT
ncbi:MAG: ADP-ribosylglycohydrolase family protein [bacterium]